MLQLEESTSINTNSPSETSFGLKNNRFFDLGMIIVLFLVESLTFLPVVKNIGFYLDDWATFTNLHFANHNFIDVLRASLNDPRMITRPVQCLYYAVTYMCFGDQPLGYHLLRCAIEAAGAVFLYLGLARFSKSRSIAAIASLLFLLYPTHDASHYWIGAGLGAGTGLALYLLSFWLLNESLVGRKTYWLSVFAFALSAYCYEAFLPLLSLSFFAAFQSRQEKEKNKKVSIPVLVGTLTTMLPFLLVGLSEPFYQRAIVPIFTHVFLSPSRFDLSYFVSVFAAGLNVSLGPDAFVFIKERFFDGFRTNWSSTRVVFLAAIALICSLPFVLAKNENVVPKNALYLFASALITLITSYLTFAVADGYTPVLATMMNRVNTGASVGASLILAIGIVWLASKMRGKAGQTFGMLALSLPFILSFTLADWGLSGHWISSWQVQKRVRELVAGRIPQLSKNDAILLVNCPRYVMWAPVFDGVWDFQEMSRMVSGRKDLVAGVVSERFELGSHDIKDYSCGFLCASYPYESLTMLVPNSEEWIKVSTAAEFIEVVERKGMGFGLSTEALAKWKKQKDGLELR